MLKQFSLLKQFGSAAKAQDASELLSENLALVEQRVEPARRVAQIVYKKLAGCLQSQQGLDAERRMKKLPLMLLSVSMAESLKDLDRDSSLRKVLEMTCFMQSFLAKTLADFEVQLEKEVLEPLSKLSEEDLAEILRNKKQFAKLTSEWLSARNRSQTSSGPQAKQDGLREDMEEAWRKLENIKDQYSADLYHFASKEDNYASYFVRLLDLQADYHRMSLGFLERNISELKENCFQAGKQDYIRTGSFTGKVFGRPLISHLLDSGEEIAVPIRLCVQMLLETGLKEEGLFRLAAAACDIKKLKCSLDCGDINHTELSSDPHAVAGVLKSYLRELPEPLMTFNLYNDWFRAAGQKEVSDRLEQLKGVLEKLPQENYNNLRYLMKFLARLTEHQDVNKMSPSNIAIVLGPNLLWPRPEGDSLLDMASAYSVQVVTVIEPLVQYADDLFPEGEDFAVSEDLGSPDLSESLLQGMDLWMTSTHGTSLSSSLSLTDRSWLSSFSLAAETDLSTSPSQTENPPSHTVSQESLQNHSPDQNQHHDQDPGPSPTCAQTSAPSPNQSQLSPTVATETQKDQRLFRQHRPHPTQQSTGHKNPGLSNSAPSCHSSNSAPSRPSGQPIAPRSTLSAVTSQGASASRSRNRRAMVKAPTAPPPPPPCQLSSAIQ